MSDTVGVPRRPSFSDIAISTIAGVDTVGGIQSILMNHDRGYFNTSAMLWDAMKRDDRISGVIKTRVGALIAAPLEIEAANGKAKAARVAKLLSGDGEDEHGLWEQMCPPATIKKLSEWGNALGFGLAEIIWNTAADASSWTQIAPGMDYNKSPGRVGWVPRLRLWHPQFVYWDTAQRRYMVIAQEGVLPLPRIDENPYSDGKWVVWCPYGYQYGWLDGLVRSLADKYLMRGWDYRDWARYNERHGMATIGAQVPADADEDVKQQFTQDLSRIGSDAVVELPQIAGENKFDMKMIEAKSRSFDSFQLFKKELDVDIAVAVLGQNLTTEGGTDGGSRALGQVQNLVRIDKAIEDAGIATCLRQQVLTWWCLYNWNDPELAPRPAYQVQPPEDELKEATALKMMGDALGSMKTASAPIDVRTILDRAGVPMISEEEEAAQAAVAAEERAAALEAQQQQGQGGGDGGGDAGDGGPPAAGGDKKPPPSGAALTTSMRLPIPGPVKRYTFAGLPIAVENEAGSLRQWRDPGPGGGVIGSTTMRNDYGYIEGHLGSDDEELDCYIGPNEAATHVHVVHQLAAPEFKAHDEDKIMLGWDDPGAAKAAYLAHRSDEKAFGGMSTIPLKAFVRKLKVRTSTGKIRASAVDVAARRRETIEALVRLSDRDGTAAALRAERTPQGKRRAASYADGVADRGKQLAARALAVDLAAIKEEIDAASSFEDLRRRVLARYKGMDPKRLAGIVEKARIMANLGGRESALKEV
jgi:phage gp29-like protein